MNGKYIRLLRCGFVRCGTHMIYPDGWFRKPMLAANILYKSLRAPAISLEFPFIDLIFQFVFDIQIVASNSLRRFCRMLVVLNRLTGLIYEYEVGLQLFTSLTDSIKACISTGHASYSDKLYGHIIRVEVVWSLHVCWFWWMWMKWNIIVLSLLIPKYNIFNKTILPTCDIYIHDFIVCIYIWLNCLCVCILEWVVFED